jgi:hypothetical protein
MTQRLGWRGLSAVAARPWLWPAAVRQAWRLVPDRWWRRPPFVPVPDAEYLRFRMATQYGDPGRQPAADDLVAYLRWCRHAG